MEYVLSINKALSDRNRLRIVAALSNYGELCACQITEMLQVTGATASRHLSLLQTAGLLDSRKEGRWIYYSLNACLGPAGSLQPIGEWLQHQFQQSQNVFEDMKHLEAIVAMDRADLCRRQRGEKCWPEKSVVK